MSSDHSYLDAMNDNEENCFVYLYDAVVDIILRDTNMSVDEVSRAIQLITESFHYDKGHSFAEIDYERKENVCGYLSRFAATHSGLVRRLLYTAIQDCSAMQNLLQRVHINVVSVGGGPGSDLIGFCSMFHDNVINVQGPLKRLNLTVLDLVQSWSYCLNKIECLAKDRGLCFGNVSKLFQATEVTTSFIQTNMSGTRSLSAECAASIKGADVILMAKFLSILHSPPHISPSKARIFAVQAVLRHMETGSLLLIIDPLAYVKVDQLEELGLARVYQSPVQEFELRASSRYDIDDQQCQRQQLTAKGSIFVFEKISA